MTTSLADRFVNYIMKIECRYCSTEVYPHEDDARAAVEYWIKHNGVRTVEQLRGVAEKTCDGCQHMADSD
jgi:hypothetical protein